MWQNIMGKSRSETVEVKPLCAPPSTPTREPTLSGLSLFSQDSRWPRARAPVNGVPSALPAFSLCTKDLTACTHVPLTLLRRRRFEIYTCGYMLSFTKLNCC